jgi:hypothetical protein
MFKIFPYAMALIIIFIIGSVAGGQGYGIPEYVFVAYYDGGVRVYDVSDPFDPVDIGGCETKRLQALDIQVRDNYAYVADGYGGMQIYDISDLEDIELANSFKRPANARAISLMDNLAFIAADNSIQIYDVSDPLEAYWISTYEIDIQYDQDIVAVDDYAYVACGVNGLKILDVSDPWGTHMVGKLKARGMSRSLAVDGNFVYIAAGAAGLQVVDVTDKSNPERVGDGFLTGDAAWGVCVNGDYAYVADRNDGVRIIDISTPWELVEVGAYKLHRGKATAISVAGDYAFVAAQTGDLQVLDVSDPASPVRIAWIETRGTARAVAVIS